MQHAARSLAPFLVPLALGARALGQHTERASLSSTQVPANDYSRDPSVSADGRFVAFTSWATNLVPSDTNGQSDVFVRDVQMGTIARASLTSLGQEANGANACGAITPDGRFVVFSSHATNLVAGDTNGAVDVFVRDLQTGTTERVSVATTGAQGNSDSSGSTSISSDGRFVAFGSTATTFGPGDSTIPDIYVRDRQNGTTERVSVATGGTPANHTSDPSFLSGDGRFVAFRSGAWNLVPGDTNGAADTFVRDRQTGVTERVSVSSGGAQANGSSWSRPSISHDGRYVVFDGGSTNLVPGDTNGFFDVFLRDRQAGTTQRVSLAPGGAQANGTSDSPFISANGLHVTFRSYADNLVPNDTNSQGEIFVHDLGTGTTERASVSSSGGQGNSYSYQGALSAGGHYVVFETDATNLVPGPDTNGVLDVLLRARPPVGFASLCDPGLSGVIPCPCSNPPSEPGRGCNNSSATGGANLSAYGGASLSADSLVFTTRGQKPRALSILAQWIGGSATGVAFGQGVRCTSGTFKRLFADSASGGSVAIPNFALGDPTISARSAAKGDTILAGQDRWYVVYYRDNTILGGCAPTSNFNATQTGQVTWSP